MAAFVDLADALMQLTAPSEREPLVRGVPDQRVPEAEPARHVRVALDELGQPLPELRLRRGRFGGEHVVDHLAVEDDAEHGGPAQQSALPRREAVDARAHDRVDRVGQLGRAFAARRADELLQEERVAACAADELGDGGLVEPVACRRTHELRRLVVVQRLEQNRHRGDRRHAVGGDKAVVARAPGAADRPRPRRVRRAEVAQQLGRRLVDPVHVFDQQQRRIGQQRPQELLDDTVQPCPPERGLELEHLRRRQHLDVER